MEKTTVLIPEELKQWAKQNGINMSFTLRKALNEERERRGEK